MHTFPPHTRPPFRFRKATCAADKSHSRFKELGSDTESKADLIDRRSFCQHTFRAVALVLTFRVHRRSRIYRETIFVISTTCVRRRNLAKSRQVRIAEALLLEDIRAFGQEQSAFPLRMRRPRNRRSSGLSTITEA